MRVHMCPLCAGIFRVHRGMNIHLRAQSYMKHFVLWVSKHVECHSFFLFLPYLQYSTHYIYCTDVTLSLFFFHMYCTLLIILYRCHSFFLFLPYVLSLLNICIVSMSLFLFFSSICTVFYSLCCTDVTLSFFFFHMYLQYSTHYIVPMSHFFFSPYVLCSTH